MTLHTDTHTHSPDLADRIESLGRAADLAEGRVADDVLTEARDLANRARERHGLSSAHTVVALAGATGSGKSSLYNALTGLDLSTVGVCRPTTSTPHACLWGPEGAGRLLDWLGVPAHQRRTHDSELDLHPDDDLVGLVLLDLPDHDSTETVHRDEVDRVAARADLVVWVTDPQKYADASAHDRYLRPLADADVVTVVVLNQVDRLRPDEAEACLEDLRRLVAEDGLKKAPVVATSAQDGSGVDALRSMLAREVAGHRAAGERLRADVARCADRLASGLQAPEGDGRDAATGRDGLVDALVEASGVAALADAAEETAVVLGWRASTWPPARWWVRRSGGAPVARRDTGAPPVSRAAVDRAARETVDAGVATMPPSWVRAVRARVSGTDDLVRALEGGIREVDVSGGRRALAWRVRAVVHVLLLVAGTLGLVGLAVAGLSSSAAAGLAPDALPGGAVLQAGSVALVGLGGGLLLAVASGVRVRAEAARRGDTVREALHTAVSDVAERHVLGPLREEQERLGRLHDALARARGA